MEDFTKIGTLDLKKSYHHSGPSQNSFDIMGPNAFLNCQTKKQPGYKPLVVNVVAVGLFEEEEEGICIPSDGARGKWRGFSTGT